ncbi:uroporphyrinogen III methylase [Marinomonas sp. MED121]|uniref:uroporphyrinogen-III C-methyltransferase n=1 Tax=Marinomonas sp. MED121 TaxID=314277 RepID=UPI0000690FE6|nr:uroporphyrinogen-III C-methyltransferase [Marinomonas sp. MED121]EAQ67302.1 uroporphyrinogen III methylase [Marinomonas sp. MED121]
MADQIDNKEQDKANTDTQHKTDSTSLESNTSSLTQESTMTSQSPAQSSKRPNNTLLYATLAVSLGALSLSGWQFYQASLEDYDAKLSRISQSNAKLETILAQQTQTLAQVEPIKSAVSKVIPALKKLETDDQNTQENTAKLGAEITSVRKQLSRLKNTSKEDWKLAEAEYLVRLANQRLLMEKDINGAEQMLVSADAILAEMKDPLLFDTRRALAKDIQALKSTRSFDLEGVYLQLEALSSQVKELPQKEASKLFSQAAKQDSTDTPEPELSYMKALGQDIWQTLRSLVVINYNSKPIKPLLPPTEYQQLVTGIQLQVNVAQLALMKQESSVYQIALEHIANAVNEHFDIDSAGVSGYLTSLTALQQINVSPELPLPRDSLTSMRDLMQTWNGKGKNNQEAIQAPAETLGISAEQDIVAKPLANDVPELEPVDAKTEDVILTPSSSEAQARSESESVIEDKKGLSPTPTETETETSTGEPSIPVAQESLVTQESPAIAETPEATQTQETPESLPEETSL